MPPSIVTFAVSFLKKKNSQDTHIYTLHRIRLGSRPSLVTTWIGDKSYDITINIWTINNLTTLISESMLGAPPVLLVMQALPWDNPIVQKGMTIFLINYKQLNSHQHITNFLLNYNEGHINLWHLFSRTTMIDFCNKKPNNSKEQNRWLVEQNHT